MSTAQAMKTVDAMERDLARDLDRRLHDNVTPLRLEDRADIGAELESVAGIHRRAIAKHRQIIADIRKRSKAEVSGLEADKKALKKQFEEDTALLSERIAGEKERAAADISAAKRLVESSEAALSVLTKDE